MPKLTLSEVWQVGVVGKECVARAYVRSDLKQNECVRKKNEWNDECSLGASPARGGKDRERECVCSLK